jgi:hypothetical protein
VDIITATELKKFKIEDFKTKMPFKLMANEEVIALVGKPEDYIFIGDMHPRVQAQMRAREQMVRMGMPKDVRASYVEVREAEKQEELVPAQ